MKTARWTAVSMLAALLACGVASVEAATIYVGEGDSLQDALDAAQPGDTILLQQGAEFVGTFVLPAKGGDAWIVIRTSAPDTVLPADGVRIHPAHAPLLARLRSPTLDTAALRTAPGAHHWDIRYLEFGGNPAGSADIMQLGDGSALQNALDLVPHHIVLRHVYVHGDPLIGQKRCIALNAAHVTIADSYVSDCKSTTQDSQAIGGWNGPGPYTIENNYLEAAGENVMIGGADPSITDLVPSDIVFRGNHFSRPMAWRNPIIPTPQAVFASPEAGGSLAPGTYAYRVVARRLVGGTTMGRSTASAEVTATVTSDTGGAVHIRWDPVPDAAEYQVYGRSPGTQTIFWRVTTPEFFDSGAAGTSGAVPTSAGTTWMVKNVFELKNARNVLLDGNVFDNHWKADQPGWAVVLTPRNSGGACTWCVVEHVTFQYNLFANIAGGINMTGYDSPPKITKQTNDIKILQNLFIMTTALGGPAYMLQMGDEPRDVKVHHNTIDSNGSTVVYVYGGTAADPDEVLEFEYYANASRHGSFGLNGAFFSFALGIINGFYPGGRIEKNYLAGAPLSRYPAGTLNVVPFEAQFVDVPNGDYRVRDGSPLKGVAPPDPRFCDIPETCTNADIGADIATLVTRIADVRPGPPDNVPGRAHGAVHRDLRLPPVRLRRRVDGGLGRAGRSPVEFRRRHRKHGRVGDAHVRRCGHVPDQADGARCRRALRLARAVRQRAAAERPAGRVLLLGVHRSRLQVHEHQRRQRRHHRRVRLDVRRVRHILRDVADVQVPRDRHVSGDAGRDGQRWRGVQRHIDRGTQAAAPRGVRRREDHLVGLRPDRILAGDDDRRRARG